MGEGGGGGRRGVLSVAVVSECVLQIGPWEEGEGWEEGTWAEMTCRGWGGTGRGRRVVWGGGV